MSAETLVLLPGMMCDERLFAPQIEAFSGDFDIIVPRLDQPSIEAMGAHVIELVTAERFSLAGLSMGGIVAMALVGMAPERVARLALLDTNHLAEPAERAPTRNRQIEAVKAGRLRDVIIDEMKPNYLATQHQSDTDLLDLLIEMAMDVGGDAFIAQSIALRDRGDQISALAGYRGPSLVLCGDEDRLCTPQRHQEIAALLQNCELEIVPEAGHISTLESPETVNNALAKWLL